MKEMIYIGSDHAGLELKEKIKKYLDKKKIDYEDVGAFVLDEGDDYPDYAFKVGELVVKYKGKGIVICGSGVGVSIAANKVKGVRAVEGYDVKTTSLSRKHNDANVLSLNGWDSDLNKIKKIIDVFLKTKFSGAERHKRRIRKIQEYER